ncbi:MAG: SprB repeat-containing protein, partial [Bacteroidota bacterium]
LTGPEGRTIDHLCAGTYSDITIISVHTGCEAVWPDDIVITEPSAPSVTVTSTDVDCNGSGGTATATPSGGSGNYTYLWSNGATTQTITGLTEGTYSVVVTDTDNTDCTASGSVVVEADLSTCEDSFDDPFFNDCGDGRVIDVQMQGLTNDADNCVTIANTSDMVRVIAEVWIEESDCPSGFPDAITFTADGGSAVSVTGIDAASSSATSVPERIYRATFTGTVSEICLSDISGCGLTSIALFIERTSEDGTSSFSPINAEVFQGHTPAGEGECLMTNLSIGESDLPRDVNLFVPIHEKDNSREVTVSFMISDDAGNQLFSGEETFTMQNSGPEAALYSMMLEDVPGNGTVIEIEVCSPAGTGDSFGIGAVAASTNESCFVCDLAVSINAGQNTVEVCDGESVTLTAQATAGTLPYSYLWSTGATTPSITLVPDVTDYSVTVTDAAGCTAEDDITSTSWKRPT